MFNRIDFTNPCNKFMMICYFFLLCFLQDSATEDAESNVIRFDEIDRDNDGRITYNELEQWQKASSADVDEQKLKFLFQNNDKNKDGTLSIGEFVPLALVLTRKPIRQSEQLFKRVDTNGDGAIVRDEALNSGDALISKQIVDGIFQVADFNRDGKITLNEFSSIIDSDPSIGRPKTQEQQNLELARRLMTLIDQNGDQKLSSQEVHSFANTNAKVSEIEVLRAFEYIDFDHDGFLRLHELIALPNKMVELVHFKEPPLVSA